MDSRDREGYDDGYRNGLRLGEAWKKKYEVMQAVACGAVTVLEKQGLFEELDFKEIGVTREQVLKWRAGHRKQDEQRLAKEAEEARVKAIKKKAISKLSPEERQVLGL